MDKEFWRERWESNRIGFHQAKPNAYLERFWGMLERRPGERVFVPLCGKSLDMSWLAAQGHPVLGVELSEIAIRDFFAEQGITPVCSRSEAFKVWQYQQITLYQGDFFHLHVGHLEDVRAIYDRAALVALPLAMRQRYAFHLAQLIYPGTPMLLVTLEYADGVRQGPPFSVPEAEVRTLFGANFEIRCLHRSAQPDPPLQGGMVEVVYRLVRKGRLENIGRYR